MKIATAKRTKSTKVCLRLFFAPFALLAVILYRSAVGWGGLPVNSSADSRAAVSVGGSIMVSYPTVADAAAVSNTSDSSTSGVATTSVCADAVGVVAAVLGISSKLASAIGIASPGTDAAGAVNVGGVICRLRI